MIVCEFLLTGFFHNWGWGIAQSMFEAAYIKLVNSQWLGYFINCVGEWCNIRLQLHGSTFWSSYGLGVLLAGVFRNRCRKIL